jgi:hypothetical protein
MTHVYYEAHYQAYVKCSLQTECLGSRGGRYRASYILTRLREAEPFAGNEHWELFKTHSTPCLCNTKTQTIAENGANLTTFLTVTRGEGREILVEKVLRLRERSYLKGCHMACFPECSIPVQIRYLAAVGHK